MTGYDLAEERLKELVPFMMELWQMNPELHEQTAQTAAVLIDQHLAEMRIELDQLYNEEIIAVLRATSSERARFPNWEPLLSETRELFERQVGVQAARRLLGNLA